MTPAHKIVIDEYAGVPVRQPTDRRASNDNAIPPDIKAGIREYIELVRQDPTCVCEQINDLDSQGLLDGLPPIRCPVHG
jgi:hypothetical protein